MGCEFQFFNVRTFDRKKIEKEFASRKEAGRLNMCQTLVFTGETVNNYNEAVAFLESKCEQFGPALAVWYMDGDSAYCLMGGYWFGQN